MQTKNVPIRYLLITLAVLAFARIANAQADDICAESGLNPSLDSPFAHIPYVFGRVVLKGFDPAAKIPKVTVILGDGSRAGDKLILDKSGNYCFKRKSTSGTLIVEVDGTEAVRRTLPSFSEAQNREDFEIFATQSQRSSPPAVVSTKFSRPPNEKTLDLYKRANEAEKAKETDKAIAAVKGILVIDPDDFIAWAKLGSLYFAQRSYPEADAAFRKALELRVDYTPAWIAVGQLRVAQKGYPAAIEIFKHATEIDPTSTVAFQQLGETYLLNKQGSLAVDALNQAIKLDPIGMAECHLQLAHLYELAGAKQFAAHEYKIFLTKAPDHPDKKKFEKYIKDNPDDPTKN